MAEEWTRDETDDRDKHTTPTMHKWRARYGGKDTWSLCHESSAFRTHSLAFDPSVTEAAAALGMPHNNVGNAYTREAVHSHIRAHGTVEAMESITPWLVVGDSAQIACPGCGTWGGSRSATWVAAKHNAKDYAPFNGKRPWHDDCLARVQARTTAAEPVEPAAPRPFRKGDRVRHRDFSSEATVTRARPCTVSGMPCLHVVRDDGTGIVWMADRCTLVTPAPEAPQTPPGPEPAKLLTKHRCRECDVVVTAENVGCTYGPAAHVCIDCMRKPEPAPYVHEGAVPTNPAGFPVMPVSSVQPRYPKCAAVLGDPQDFDTWLAAREQRYDGPVFDVGDIVEGPWVGYEDTWSRGRVTSRIYPCVIIETRQGHAPSLDARRCRLVQRKEDR